MTTNGTTNGSNGNGHHETPVNITRVTDMTQMLTVSEVAEEFGVSAQAVRNWQRKGKITPYQDAEGTTRFDPAELEIFRTARGMIKSLEPSDLVGEDGNSKLQRADSLIIANLLSRPRERIDELQFRMIERLMARCEKLESERDALLKAREEALDQTAERQLVSEILTKETKMKEDLVKGVTETGKRLLERAGGKGAPAGIPFLDSCTKEQLQTMLLLEGLYSPDQQVAVLRKLQELQRREASTAETPVDAGTQATTESTPAQAPVSAAEAAATKEAEK